MTCPHLDPYAVFSVGCVLALTALLVISYLVRTVRMVRLGEYALEKFGKLKEKQKDAPSLDTAYAQMHKLWTDNILIDGYLYSSMREIQYRERRAAYNDNETGVV
jgi:hypothetical protein